MPMPYYRKKKWKNWNIGDKVKLNPAYSWEGRIYDYEFKLVGEVVSLGDYSIGVKWEDNLKRIYYSYPDESLLKLNDNYKPPEIYIPDELFEI